MKKATLLLAALLLATGLAAQNPTLYFMEGSTYRSQLNPAFAPQRGYVNLPGIGGMEVGINGNVALDNILYPRNGRLVTLLDSSVPADVALSGLSAQNRIGAETRINLFGIGMFTANHKNFWSFDLALRTSEETTLPRSLFEFLKRGEEGHISNIGLMAESYLEAGFNYSMPLLDDRLYIGFRGKLLVGLARMQMDYDRFDVTLQNDRWAVATHGTIDITADGTKANPDPESGLFGLGDLETSPKGPRATDLPSTWAPRTTSCPSCRLRWRSPTWASSAGATGRASRASPRARPSSRASTFPTTAPPPRTSTSSCCDSPPWRAPHLRGCCAPRSTPHWSTSSGSAASASDCSTRSAS